jgi:ketosteroid isomerase-like protein
MEGFDRSIENEIIALEHEVQQAVQEQDRETLERLIAPGFRLATTRSGNPGTREDWIATATGPFRIASFQMHDFTVTVDGDTAVVTRRMRQQAAQGDRKAIEHWFTTDVWVKRGPGWQLLARHSQPLDQ